MRAAAFVSDEARELLRLDLGDRRDLAPHRDLLAHPGLELLRGIADRLATDLQHALPDIRLLQDG